MTLSQLFDLSLVLKRDRVALEADRSYTFSEVDARASRMARALAARGVGAGDRLCIYLPNSIDFIALYLASTRLGAIFVPMNVLYRDRELRHIIDDADPVAVIVDASNSAFVPDAKPLWSIEQLRRDAEREPDTRVPAVDDADSPAMIIYTSGTTGAPKGAVVTHNMLVTNAINLVTCWQISDADRLHLMLPLFHVHGLGFGLHCWLVSGCVLRLEERFDHQVVERQLRDFQPTLFFGVPAMYVRLLGLAEEAARAIGSRMRLFVSGSAPLPVHVLEHFRDLFGHTILERYGMSETLVNTSNPYVGERRPGTVGLPMPGVSVRICDADGHPVGDGTTGEVCVRGPNVFTGYWRNPSATENAFRNSWFRTGDVGMRTSDGYLTLQARLSDMIISGGFNIYPREIEDFLCEQPGVSEAAVTGLADAIRGEVPIAYIVPAGPWDPARLEQACRDHLASFKVPRKFIEIERLPRTSLGKIQKQLLQPSATHRTT